MSAANAVYLAVNQMEADLARLDGLTQVLFGLGGGPSKIDPEAMDALAHAFADVVTRAEGHWREANDRAFAARGLAT